jgi:hypothetical protein
MVLASVTLAGWLAFAEEPAVERHPMEVERAVCSECHPGRWTEHDHLHGWDRLHRFPAVRDGALCGICHRKAFCAECHANKEEIKPSDKHKDRPWRESPHRGDYLTRHQIDAKINPAPCFRCHGRRNNETCRRCHR